MSGGLRVFFGADLVQASGFVAVYVAGLVVGNRRHRGAQVILRFFDGLSWLGQIVMFLLLGLLMTPKDMQPYLVGSGVAAAVLILLARPAAEIGRAHV